VRPRATVRVVAQPQPKLVPTAELERIRCAARSGGSASVTVLALLDHIGIQQSVIVAMSSRVEQDGTDEERDRVRAALEAIDQHPPIHIRLEFEVATGRFGERTAAAFIAAMRHWSVNELADLTDIAQATVTYRGESQSWETRTP
jgi:hypothetical protein